MAKDKTLAAISFFRERLLADNVSVSKIVLFGPRARGKADLESDIDIVLISKGFRGKNIFKRIEITKDAEVATIKKFMLPMDIITMPPEEFASGNSLVSEFAKKGKVLFAA